MKRKPNPYIIALVLIDLSILAFTYFCSEVHEDGLTTFFYSGIVAGITCIILLLLRRKWAFIFFCQYTFPILRNQLYRRFCKTYGLEEKQH